MGSYKVGQENLRMAQKDNVVQPTILDNFAQGSRRILTFTALRCWFILLKGFRRSCPNKGHGAILDVCYYISLRSGRPRHTPRRSEWKARA